MFPIFDAEGSRLYPGRWNTASAPVIYTSEHYSTAMLEKLVHANGIMPKNQHYVEIRIPNGVSYEVFSEAHNPGWAMENEEICKSYGAEWRHAMRSALLIVPSIPARIERNFIINPDHPDVKNFEISLHHPIWWDSRLYG
jgi:RES domain-containing protein